MYGFFPKELIHLIALTRLASLLFLLPSSAAFPDPLPSPIARSRDFHHA